LKATWYDNLSAIKSLGSTSGKPGSLAGLHQARQEHLSQFFTPDDIAQFIWKLATPIIDRSLAKLHKSKISILDNSVGTGRLLQFADPLKHILGGYDIHQPSIDALIDACSAAGFDFDFIHSGMQDAKPRHYDIAIINPPFSIHLESPNLEPYACTTWGRFGVNTSANSHAYALYQAMEAADVVFAILPKAYAKEIALADEIKKRFKALIHLPKGSFREENTEVDTSILVLGYAYEKSTPFELQLKSLDQDLPELDINCGMGSWGAPKLGHVDGYTDTSPSITLPVTNNTEVTLNHHGRYIVPKFKCGLTQAKVMNAILQRSIKSVPLDKHRYPSNVKYTGQGKLDIEIHLAQDDSNASLEALINTIKDAGANPIVSQSLKHYFAKRVRNNTIKTVPFRHVVYTESFDNSDFTGESKSTHAIDPKKWGSPIIKMGETINFTKAHDQTYHYTIKEQPFVLTHDELIKRFDITKDSSQDWKVVHEGRVVKFPQLAKPLFNQAKKLGIDKWLSWDYQLDDLVELCIAPGDAILAYEMGLGKARMAIALILMSGCKHGLITVESQLVDEMLKEFTALGIDPNLYKVISKASDLKLLRQINIISYERLRLPINQQYSRRTYATQMRRRIGVMVSDEGHLLRKRDTEQTKALWMVSPRRKYILTGTPAANYPRDIHQLLVFEGGDGTAVQPYGYENAYLQESQLNHMVGAKRGIDAFRDNFVVTEWCTNEFKEGNENGAKREVPKIANLVEYRNALACHVKRRIAQEPEVAAHISIPVPNVRVTTLPWDNSHLKFYLDVAEDFMHWYTDMLKKSGEKGKNVNLIALLARIQAVQTACNYPQRCVKGFGGYHHLTSKQRYAIKRLKHLVAQGKKIIFYAENPGLLNIMHQELKKVGVESLVFTGEINIKKRTAALDENFRFGDKCQVLLASLGVTQNGLNIPQSSYVMYYDRAWDYTTESQAGARVLRPQQENEVDFEFLHIEGSIDEYQAQMVAHKKDSIKAGVDWATPDLDNVEFLHLDTLLGRFVKDLAEKLNVDSFDVRKAIAA